MLYTALYLLFGQLFDSHTQNEKLSKSCQTNCHYDNFMVVMLWFMVVIQKLSRLLKQTLSQGQPYDNYLVVRVVA